MAEYITREAALNIVNGWCNQLIPTYGKNDEYVKCLETVAEHLESLHAADVRPAVRGRWIKHNATHVQKGGMYLECSCCHEYITVLGHVFAYCPNCGADMREEN